MASAGLTELHCLNGPDVAGQRRLKVRFYVNFTFLSLSEHPHTRSSGGLKHKPGKPLCKGKVEAEILSWRQPEAKALRKTAKYTKNTKKRQSTLQGLGVLP